MWKCFKVGKMVMFFFKSILMYFLYRRCFKYCWWTKSCTTWDVQNPVNNGINYQPQLVQDVFHQQYLPAFGSELATLFGFFPTSLSNIDFPWNHGSSLRSGRVATWCNGKDAKNAFGVLKMCTGVLWKFAFLCILRKGLIWLDDFVHRNLMTHKHLSRVTFDYAHICVDESLRILNIDS